MKSKGQLTKERILAEATSIVKKKGFGATSISDIMNATGIKKGSLYFHFPEKNAITLAVLDNVSADFMRFLDTSLTAKTPGDALNNFFDNVLKMHKDTGFIGGCIFGNTALEMSDTCEEVAQKVNEVFLKWTEKLKIVVEATQGTRQVRYDISADMLTNQIIATIEGGIMLSRMRKDEKPLRDCLDSLKLLIQVK